MAEERFRAVLSAAFGFTALVLAAVGLYGVIARRTAGRRRQFGIRVALGARPADVSGLVIRDAALLVVLGLALGLPAGYWLIGSGLAARSQRRVRLCSGTESVHLTEPTGQWVRSGENLGERTGPAPVANH